MVRQQTAVCRSYQGDPPACGAGDREAAQGEWHADHAGGFDRQHAGYDPLSFYCQAAYPLLGTGTGGSVYRVRGGTQREDSGMDYFFNQTNSCKCMKSKKFLLSIGLICINSLLLRAQIITLGEVQKMAEANYPAIARYDIVEKTKEFSISNANKAYLPQGTLMSQATWQSD